MVPPIDLATLRAELQPQRKEGIVAPPPPLSLSLISGRSQRTTNTTSAVGRFSGMYHDRFVWRGGGSMCFDSMTRGIPKLLFGKGGGYQLPNGTLPPPRPLLHYYNSRRVAVCTRRLLPPLIPCLFLSPTTDGKILPMFNPTDRRFYEFPIPKKVRGPDNSVRGSGLGWLVMLKSNINLADYYEDYVDVSSSNSELEEEEDDDNEMEIINDDVDTDDDEEDNTCTISLYNPFTGTHIPLPPILGNIISNGKVLCDPVKASPGQPLLSIMYMDDILLYCQGDKNWSVIAPPPGVRFAYCTYHEAEATLYVIGEDGRLSVLDPATRTLRPLIDTPSPEIQSSEECVYNLGVDAAGDVLMFLMTRTPPPSPQKYRVLKLDKTCLKWVRTPNIGNQALFEHLYYDSLVCDPGFTDAKPNQIYCFKQHRYRAALGDGKHIELPAEVGVLDLTDAGVQEEQLLFETSNILKGHQSIWYHQFGAWMMVPSHEFKD